MNDSQQVLSHWHRLVENHQASSMQFYEDVRTALAEQQIPQGVESRIAFKESGAMSANREYLRIVRGSYSFDICAAPFGSGFFYSWWLSELRSPHGVVCFIAVLGVLGFLMMITTAMSFKWGVLFFFLGAPSLLAIGGVIVRDNHSDLEPLIVAMPLFGWIYRRFINPLTFYTYDTALMFQDAVHNAVIEVLDRSLCAQGLKALTENQRKPILKAFSPNA